ncbi:YdaU family protein [Stenotrophomonas lactitubi]|uniref:YdaU family protein n=1 Tax=Stenotrophomonas lactitubi TaxID=2045214 RepID=UPI00203A4AA5|nr:YdaU family protein [Stenotrophomonas lactitubi]
MIYFEMYPGDYLKDTTRLSLVEHGAYFKLMLAYYAEEQALPESLAELHIIAGAISAGDKAAVKKVAERYFPVAEDGLRHSKRCDEQIATAQTRIADGQGRREDKRAAEAERQARTRARRTMLFEDLRNVGVVPSGLASMAELKALHITHVTGDEGVTLDLLSRVTSHGESRVTGGVNTGVNTGNQTPDPRSITPDTSLHAQGSLSGASDAGRACVLMRQAGCHSTNPSHPDLIAALAEGVTPQELADTAAEGLTRSPPVAKPFPWAIQTARSRKAAGATPTNTTNPGGPNANPQLGSAEHVAEQRRLHEQRAAAGGFGGSGGDVIEGEFQCVQH